MRYYFNVWFDGQYVTDHEGSELSSDEQAQAEGFASALELERDFPHSNDNSASSILEVLDQNGRRIVAVPVCRKFCSSLP